jgi:glycogen operon protein
MGDEVRHTRQGNNNPWCQDNELNWLDWDGFSAHEDLFEFTRKLNQFTRSVDLLQSRSFWTVTSPEKKGQVTWHGTKLNKPDWSAESRVLAFTLGQAADEQIIHCMLNASRKDLTFQLPVNRAGMRWIKVIDTAAPAPRDLVLPGPDSSTLAGSVKVMAKSLILVQENPAKR